MGQCQDHGYTCGINIFPSEFVIFKDAERSGRPVI
jgi:hypothetical protein